MKATDKHKLIDRIKTIEGLSDDERANFEPQIAALERQMRSTTQPRRQRKIFVELQKPKGLI